MDQNIADNACTLLEEDKDAYKKHSLHIKNSTTQQREDRSGSSCCCVDNAAHEKKPREGNKEER